MGNQSTIGGNKVIATSSANSMTRNNQPSRTIAMMGMPVSALVTNSNMPNGGCINPIIMLSTTNTPK